MDELKIESESPIDSFKRFKSNSLYELGERKLIVAHGDIVNFEADAIVNETTEELVANVSDKEDFVGIGVSAAINKACGPKLREACLEIKEVSPDCRCPTGEARITEAFDLRTAKYIIHTVGPFHAKYDKEKAEELLTNCYFNCLNLALDYKLERMAFPLISSGLPGYPLKEAIQVALKCTTGAAKRAYPTEIYFIMQSKSKYTTFEELARKRFNPEKNKAAKKNPFVTKGSTFRMSKSQKVMLGLSNRAIGSFQEFVMNEADEEDDDSGTPEDSDEKKE